MGICKRCKKRHNKKWYVNDKLWDKVVTKFYQNDDLCLDCFKKLAKCKNIKIQSSDIRINGEV